MKPRRGRKATEIQKFDKPRYQQYRTRIFLVLVKSFYYSVAVWRIRPYFERGMRLLQENQHCIRFLYCYTVAENWDLNEHFTVSLLTS